MSDSSQRTAAIHRSVGRLCWARNWSALHEVSLPNGRRADVLALRPDGGFVCVEIKSGARDFLTDAKWPEYLPFCDALYFAVDPDFPHLLLPAEAGHICAADDGSTAVVREAPENPLSGARRRALLLRFAQVAAGRLMAATDPAGWAAARAGLSAE